MLLIPLIEEPCLGNGGSQRRRGGGHRAAVRLANNAVRTLNLLLGFSSSAGSSGGSLHDSVRAEAVERSYLFRPGGPNAHNAFLSDEAALAELLKGRTCYDTSRAACTVKPFSAGPVALPTDLICCPDLHSALPISDRRFWRVIMSACEISTVHNIPTNPVHPTSLMFYEVLRRDRNKCVCVCDICP